MMLGTSPSMRTLLVTTLLVGTAASAWAEGERRRPSMNQPFLQQEQAAPSAPTPVEQPQAAAAPQEMPTVETAPKQGQVSGFFNGIFNAAPTEAAAPIPRRRPEENDVAKADVEHGRSPMTAQATNKTAPVTAVAEGAYPNLADVPPAPATKTAQINAEEMKQLNRAAEQAEASRSAEPVAEMKLAEPAKTAQKESPAPEPAPAAKAEASHEETSHEEVASGEMGPSVFPSERFPHPKEAADAATETSKEPKGASSAAGIVPPSDAENPTFAGKTESLADADRAAAEHHAAPKDEAKKEEESEGFFSWLTRPSREPEAKPVDQAQTPQPEPAAPQEAPVAAAAEMPQALPSHEQAMQAEQPKVSSAPRMQIEVSAPEPTAVQPPAVEAQPQMQAQPMAEPAPQAEVAAAPVVPVTEPAATVQPVVIAQPEPMNGPRRFPEGQRMPAEEAAQVQLPAEPVASAPEAHAVDLSAAAPAAGADPIALTPPASMRAEAMALPTSRYAARRASHRKINLE